MSPHRLCTLSIGLLIGTAIAQTLLAADPPPRLPQDDIERLLQAQAKQITNLRLNFTYQQDDRKPGHIRLDWDLPGDRVNATIIYAPAEGKNPISRTWVRNHRQEWEAHPEYAAQQPGTWIVSTAPAGQLRMARQVNDGEFGLRFLRETLIPYTVLHRDAIERTRSDYKLTLVQTTDEKSRRVIRTYAGTVDGRPFDELTYQIDLSDDARIYSTTYRRAVAGQFVTLYHAQMDDFKKINGVWFPLQINVQRFDTSGKPSTTGTMQFQDAQINLDLPPENFGYEPPHGSRVTHEKTGFTYRAGYDDPASPIGQDKPASDPPIASTSARADTSQPATTAPAANPRPAPQLPTLSTSTPPAPTHHAPQPASFVWWMILPAAGVLIVVIALFVRRLSLSSR